MTATADGGATPEQLAGPVVELVRECFRAPDRPGRCLVVAVDGRSGGGKSTLARAVAAALGSGDVPMAVSVIEGDDFYGGGSAATWDRLGLEERVAGVIDWRRQRDVLEALRRGDEAAWFPFDWFADDWDADVAPRSATASRCLPTEVVVLEGAYSARPELADLVDLRVLLDPPVELRRARLLEREGEGYRTAWEERWSAAEDHYFGTVALAEGFDLVLGR